MATRSKRWIQGAIKRPGALLAAARSAGALTTKGTIKVGWLREQAKKSGRRGKQARLALTLRRVGR